LGTLFSGLLKIGPMAVIGVDGTRVEASDVNYVHVIKVDEGRYDLRAGLYSNINGSATLASYCSHAGAVAAMDELHRRLWDDRYGRHRGGTVYVSRLPGHLMMSDGGQ